MRQGLWTTAKKLQVAINAQSDLSKVLLHTRQWYSDKKTRPVSCYVVSISSGSPDGGRRTTQEAFQTYSQVQLVLWLRDYLYKLNGWEIPVSEQWEEIKNGYQN